MAISIRRKPQRTKKQPRVRAEDLEVTENATTRVRPSLPRRQRPNFTAEELRSSLVSYDRAPFQDLLNEWIRSAPDPSVVADFAEAHPDKYIQSLSLLGRMAGYTDRRETSVDVTHNYRTLSDSQLEDRLKALSERLGLPAEKLIDVSPTAARGTTETPSLTPSDIEPLSPSAAGLPQDAE